MSEISIKSISNDILNLCSLKIKSILSDISIKYNIDIDELNSNYLNEEMLKSNHKKKKKSKFSPLSLCMARKQDGNQCTRRKKGCNDYCGKHIKNRKYGRIDDDSTLVDKLSKDDNYIMTWIETFDGEEFLVDQNNIVYSKNISSPKIIGKKIGDNQLEYVDDIIKDQIAI